MFLTLWSPNTLSVCLKRGQGNAGMFLDIENNPNFEGSYFVRFNELGPPRLVTHVKSMNDCLEEDGVRSRDGVLILISLCARLMRKKWKIQVPVLPILSLEEIGGFV